MLQGSKAFYDKKVVPDLKKAFQFKSIMQVPRLEKIVLNMGLGETKNNKNVLTENLKVMSLIAGQKALPALAKRSIAGFKIREDMPIGAYVTLRRANMYDFFTRLIHLALPRVKDFHGLSPKSFDGRGNYGLGIRDSSVFAEVAHLHMQFPSGLHVQFVTSKPKNDEALAMLKLMGMPFKD